MKVTIMTNCTRCGDEWNPQIQSVKILVSDNKKRSVNSTARAKKITASVPSCLTCQELDYTSPQVREIIKQYSRIYGQP